MIVVKNKKSLLPCDYCYRKTFVYVSKVDPSILTINPVKVENWEDICIKEHQHQPLIHKVHKNLRKSLRS